MKFIFKSHEFNAIEKKAIFNYVFSDGRSFVETFEFENVDNYNEAALAKAMELAFVLVGVSYYKTFPTTEIEHSLSIDQWQADFFSRVYKNGLGQFAYENDLTLRDLVTFSANIDKNTPISYEGSGTLVLQSGGKDSLLTAALLKNANLDFESLYISSGENHPGFLNEIGSKLHIVKRNIDRVSLAKAQDEGGLNGHVPITYIVQSIALIQAILLGKNTILTSIANEGEEPHAHLDGMPVTHQWSKTFAAEVAFNEYVQRFIAKDLRIGSLLRGMSELRVAELFIQNVWGEFGHKFSSCNVANYKQGVDNTTLKWCGVCPKCVNSYLLFAPFLAKNDLVSIFNNQDLFANPKLINEFKGLLGIDGIMKPFECIGEVDELRLAYEMAQNKGDYSALPFDIPKTGYNYTQTYPSQDWTKDFIG
jgi:hypothetical protein